MWNGSRAEAPTVNRPGALAIAISSCLCLACGRPSGASQQSESKGAASAPASSQRAPTAASCAPAPPDRPNLLIDDFDANDGRPPRSAGRIAYWWSASDGTSGTLQPDPTAPDDTSPREGKALHFVARDFKKWGALVGINLFWSEGAMRCPLNASGYAGFKFRAKGSGSLAAQLLTRDTANARGGGRCETRCFDHYQRVVQITPEWSTHAIRWEDLRQLGFGQAVPLAPEYTVGMGFQAHLADLPVDVWIDDLEFIPRSPAGERSP
jgi:hypothetical protein